MTDRPKHGDGCRRCGQGKYRWRTGPTFPVLGLFTRYLVCNRCGHRPHGTGQLFPIRSKRGRGNPAPRSKKNEVQNSENGGVEKS